MENVTYVVTTMLNVGAFQACEIFFEAERNIEVVTSLLSRNGAEIIDAADWRSMISQTRLGRTRCRGLLSLQDFDKPGDIRKVHLAVLVAICFWNKNASLKSFNERRNISKVHDIVLIDIT